MDWLDDITTVISSNNYLRTAGSSTEQEETISAVFSISSTSYTNSLTILSDGRMTPTPLPSPTPTIENSAEDEEIISFPDDLTTITVFSQTTIHSENGEQSKSTQVSFKTNEAPVTTSTSESATSVSGSTAATGQAGPLQTSLFQGPDSSSLAANIRVGMMMPHDPTHKEEEEEEIDITRKWKPPTPGTPWNENNIVQAGIFVTLYSDDFKLFQPVYKPSMSGSPVRHILDQALDQVEPELDITFYYAMLYASSNHFSSLIRHLKDTNSAVDTHFAMLLIEILKEHTYALSNGKTPTSW